MVTCEEYYRLDTTGRIQIKLVMLRSLGFHHYNMLLCANDNEMPVCYVADPSSKVIDMG